MLVTDELRNLNVSKSSSEGIYSPSDLLKRVLKRSKCQIEERNSKSYDYTLYTLTGAPHPYQILYKYSPEFSAFKVII